jgi:hypothetical protein
MKSVGVQEEGKSENFRYTSHKVVRLAVYKVVRLAVYTVALLIPSFCDTTPSHRVFVLGRFGSI